MNYFFSIVVPTLNEANYLPSLLKDLENQTFKNFEVIHVDGNSDDETIEKTKKFKKALEIKSFCVKKRNVSFQRNYGAKKAKSDWIIFMDADNRLPKDFLKKIVRKIEKNKFDAFTTHIKVNSQNLAFQAAGNVFNLQMDLSNSLSIRPKALGSMIGIKKEIINKIKFDEKNKVCEDAIFVERLKKEKYKFSVLKRPKYFYSFRRVDKEGVLKMLKIVSKLQFKSLAGDNFENNNCGYQMEGGSYYEDKSKAN